MDTNRERMYEALLNREHVVCHRTLRPFCLWHMANLARVGSPFAVGGRVRRSDLLIAVAICATAPFALVQEMQPALPDKPFVTAVELDKFRVYRADFGRSFKRTDSKGKPVQAPWEMAVVARLMRYGHKSEKKAWAMPFGRALQLSSALGEANGGDPGILSEGDEKAMKRAGLMDEDEESDDAG